MTDFSDYEPVLEHVATLEQEYQRRNRGETR
jgi:hypothetical protein